MSGISLLQHIVHLVISFVYILHIDFGMGSENNACLSVPLPRELVLFRHNPSSD